MKINRYCTARSISLLSHVDVLGKVIGGILGFYLAIFSYLRIFQPTEAIKLPLFVSIIIIVLLSVPMLAHIGANVYFTPAKLRWKTVISSIENYFNLVYSKDSSILIDNPTAELLPRSEALSPPLINAFIAGIKNEPILRLELNPFRDFSSIENIKNDPLRIYIDYPGMHHTYLVVINSTGEKELFLVNTYIKEALGLYDRDYAATLYDYILPAICNSTDSIKMMQMDASISQRFSLKSSHFFYIYTYRISYDKKRDLYILEIPII